MFTLGWGFNWKSFGSICWSTILKWQIWSWFYDFLKALRLNPKKWHIFLVVNVPQFRNRFGVFGIVCSGWQDKSLGSTRRDCFVLDVDVMGSFRRELLFVGWLEDLRGIYLKTLRNSFSKCSSLILTMLAHSCRFILLVFNIWLLSPPW